MRLNVITTMLELGPTMLLMTNKITKHEHEN